MPCDVELQFELRLETGRALRVPGDRLLVREGGTCYGAVVAGAAALTVVLGTLFLSEWYTCVVRLAAADAQRAAVRRQAAGRLRAIPPVRRGPEPDARRCA